MRLDVDVDEWKPITFVRYVTIKLREIGIEYIPKMPDDIIIMASILKYERGKRKSKTYIKEQIDKIFKEYSFTTVHSLTFLRALFKVPFRVGKKRLFPTIRNKDVQLSVVAQTQLNKLKKVVHEER